MKTSGSNVSRSTFRRILGMLGPYRRSIAVGFVLLVVATPAQNFHPLVWGFIVDRVVAELRPELLLPALAVMVVVHYLGTGLGALRTYILGLAGQRFVADLRDKLYQRLMNQSIQYHHERRSGDQMARVIGDVETLQDVVINGVDSILGNALSFLWVAGIVLWLDWRVGSIALGPLLLVAVLVWLFNQKVKLLYRRIRDRLGDISAHLQEHLQGILIIKAFAREGHELRKFESINEEYTRESYRGVLVRSFYFPSVMALGFLSNVALIGGGAWMILNGPVGRFTLGDLVAYRGYWWQLFSPVFTLAQVNEMIQRASASATRIFEVLDASEPVADGTDARPLSDVSGNVRFDNVGFGYRADRPVLKNVTFEARPGQKVGIVGPSGAGKSSILGLILRMYDVQEGQISLDGHDLRSLVQASFRRHMGLVTQEPILFNDTVRENIRFGRLDATDNEIEGAARDANAHAFILDLPEGYETRVGERGVKLSGGQKQRLCIARAFIANPRVLLLDEATASVEAESEALIQAALERLMQGRTTFIVSHRLSLVRDCDAILVVEDGRISESGTHDQLLRQGGWYGRMYPLQMEGIPLNI